MNKTKGLDFIKRYTMILVLIVVTAFFAWRTGGAILLPMNVSSLISQNAYVFILATGMLLCILTGGNCRCSTSPPKGNSGTNEAYSSYLVPPIR